MEYWDAIDIHETPLNHTLIRDQPIPQGMYHYVVEILTMTPDNRVLITQRAPNKTFPLMWEITGGSVLKGETKEAGAVRELFEETGLNIVKSDLRVLGKVVGDGYLFYSFLCVVPIDLAALRMQEGETIAARLVDFRTFERLMQDGTIAPPIYDRYLTYRKRLMEILKSRG
ncbi:MAG: NUDIX domain-containing protein [Bacillus subtilis]|nr:NUDIX domain-containing protein [Bacillus subtilis]